MDDQLKACREAFEAHMRKLNPCTRLHRQNDRVGGFYRTVTIERSWQLWQAAWNTRAQAEDGEAVAYLCEKLRDRYGPDDKITGEANRHEPLIHLCAHEGGHVSTTRPGRNDPFGVVG